MPDFASITLFALLSTTQPAAMPPQPIGLFDNALLHPPRLTQSGQSPQSKSSGDSLKNGMLIGGGVGALSSLIVFAEDDYYEGECDSSGCKVGVALGVTAFYVGVGALIDHLIKGHELVYRAPPEGLALSVAPYPVRQGAGVRVGLTF